MKTTRPPEQLEQLVSFVDALPVAVWVGQAPGGECVYVNREFERMLGITPPPDAARGNYVGPYGVHLPTGEKYPEDQMPYEQAMRAGAPVVIENIVLHKHDGAKINLRVFASPLRDGAGNITHIVEAFTDKTREVDSEKQLSAARRLESVGAFAGGIAHDLNNLLAIVKLVATNLKEHETKPARLELIRHLDGVADSAARMTASLLSFARTGKTVTSRISVHDAVKGAVALFRPTLQARLDLRLSLDSETPFVLGDVSQLERAVLNLLVNARDAIPNEGALVIRTRDVTLREKEHALLQAGSYVLLEVEDSGTGIPPAVYDRIFEPFVTTKASGALHGNGMGLATVYAVARSHGGTAEISSTGPSGTTMRVYFATEGA